MNLVDVLEFPTEQYQRYLAVAEIADRVREHLGQARLSVLDVGGLSHDLDGGYSLPLVHFLPEDSVFVADITAEPMPNYALANGLSLPFGDTTFDVVTCCDTLEHIPRHSRSAFIDELLRVGSCCLVLIAPFDSQLNRRAEQILSGYLAMHEVRCPPLEEHTKHGLPSIDSLRAKLSERRLAAVDFADGYLPHWLAMMLITFSPGQPKAFHQALNRYYNTHLSPRDRREPAYRRVFVVALPGHEALVPNTSCGTGDNAQHDDSELHLATDLINVLLTHECKSQLEARGQALELENLRLRQLICNYEQGRFMRFMRFVHNWRKKMGLR